MPPVSKQRKIKSNISKINSIGDLRWKCSDHADKDKYQQLAIISARNLGCPQSTPTLQEAFQWLEINANETQSEEGVVDEINFCIDLVK